MLPQLDLCPYRSQENDPEENQFSHCQLLAKIANITNIRDRELCRVTDENCQGCLSEFSPSPSAINSMVASLLYGLTDTIIERGGVESCDVRLARQKQDWAFKNLAIVPGSDDAKRNTPLYAGPCLYLGDPAGSAGCLDHCDVPVKVFTCLHPDHETTTLQSCRTCFDYECEADRGTVRNWAVGITTAPRDKPTLESTLSSLAQAGWHHPHVFAEPGARIPCDDVTVTRRHATLGAWPNWLLGLNELVLRAPHADVYFMCQDDVVFCRGLREYLEETLWPVPRVGVVSLYCPSHVSFGQDFGFHVDNRGWDSWGALAYLFSNAAARAFLRSSLVVNHRSRGPYDGLRNVDSVVGQWCRKSKMPYFVHFPSLAQHTGDTSTLFPNASNRGKRNSSTFIGEHADVRQRIDLSSPHSIPPKATSCDETEVTVSIPVFGSGHDLRRAVDSILNQSHSKLTLVVTNDGGEPPWQELADLDDPRLVRFDLPENRGRYFADAVVLEATDAPFFLVQDSDDYSDPERLAVLLRHLQEGDHSGAISSMLYHDATTAAATATIPLRDHEVEAALSSVYKQRIHHHGLFRTEALREVGGFYGGFRIAYDTLLTNLLLMTGRLRHVDELLYHYVKRSDSLTNHPHTGLHSNQRKHIRSQLHEIYADAFHCHMHFMDGELSHSQLCSRIRDLSRRHVTSEDQYALAAESQRLRSLLSSHRSSIPSMSSKASRFTSSTRG